MDYKKHMQMKQALKEATLPLKLNIQFFADGDGEGGDKGGDGGGEGKDALSIMKEIKAASQGFAEQLKQMQKEMKEKGQVTDGTKNKVDEFEKKFTTLQDELKEMKRLGGAQPEQVKTAGQVFAESDAFKNMVSLSDTKSAPVSVDFFKKELVTSGAGSAGELIVARRQAGVIQQPDREFWLRDLLQVQNIDTNAIEYVREVGFTNNAAPVAEGQLKPQSALTFTTETASVKTIAHWVPATRQAIADANQLQAYIDNRLRYGLKLEEESQILYGDGIGDNLAGLMTDADIQDVGGVGALTPAGADPDNMVDHLRRALTRVVLAGYPATGTVLNPLNWESIELMKADNGQYLWFNLGTTIDPRLFRIPVVVTPAINQNEFLTGAFGLGAQLWDREQTTVRVGEPNDYFLRNQVAILAEERLALTKFRPEAFVTGTLTPAPAGV